MIRKILFAASLVAMPQLALANSLSPPVIVSDPQLLAVAQQQLAMQQQQLMVQKQQLAVLNTIQALEQARVPASMASAALAYAQQQGQLQAQAEQAQ